ncbi:MAG: hypothetical protein QN648_04095 [Nitrososphaeraceae archaeon]|nr:hypothetical protein [Nitrososphaeraceae archaeon]
MVFYSIRRKQIAKNVDVETFKKSNIMIHFVDGIQNKFKRLEIRKN